MPDLTFGFLPSLNPSTFSTDTSNEQQAYRGVSSVGSGIQELGEALQSTRIPGITQTGEWIEQTGTVITNLGSGGQELYEGFEQLGKSGRTQNPLGGLFGGQPSSGFTRKPGELGANQGVYAAYLNGKQGYVDMSLIDPRTGNRGVWVPEERLSADQKKRVASEFSSTGILGQNTGQGEVSGRRLIRIKLWQSNASGGSQ